VGSGSESVPILVPEQVAVIAFAAAVGGLVGAVIGVFATRRSGGKKKDDE
jgi:ABC-type enterobactin transport system permease subunit